MIEDMVAKGQKVYRKLKRAPFPVVAAPFGLALGGGCEVCLNADAVQAHAETYIGLVEAGVGMIPAWTGSTELLTRWVLNRKRPGGPIPPLAQTFETIGMAKVAKSAFEAKEMLFLREGDGISMNRDRLLADAKAKALALAADYRPPEKVELSLPGPSARLAMRIVVDGLRLKGAATPHDGVVADQLATVLSGGDTDITGTVSEDDLLRLERQAFMSLIRHPATLARIEHMLETGKPLRN
jgi:3-hydroxyacyl-CoA dehydrogenase